MVKSISWAQKIRAHEFLPQGGKKLPLPLFNNRFTEEMIKNFRNDCALCLLKSNHWNWRQRRTETITPIDAKTYRQTTIFQFSIPSEVLKEFIQNFVDSNDTQETKNIFNKLKSNVYGKTFQITVPLDRFSKRIEIDFTVRRSDQNPIFTLPKKEASVLNLQSFVDYLNELNRSRNLKSVQQLINKDRNIFHALILCFPKDIICAYRKNIRFLQNPLKNYELFFKDRLPSYASSINLSCHKTEFLELLGRINTFQKTTRKTKFPKENNLFLNPLLMIREYFWAKTWIGNEDANVQNVHSYLTEFLNACSTYIENFEKSFVALDARGQQELFETFEVHTNTYVGFIKTNITIGNELVVELTRILEGHTSRWGRYQKYEINFGFENSWHLEVVSPSSLELNLKPSKNFLKFENSKRQDPSILGIESGTSTERCHYYKTYGWAEIASILEQSGIQKKSLHPGYRPKCILWVRYRINPTIFWGNLVCLFILGFCSVSLFIFYRSNPSALDNPFGPSNIFAIGILTVIVPLIVFVVNFKETHSLTHQFASLKLIRYTILLFANLVSISALVYSILFGYFS